MGAPELHGATLPRLAYLSAYRPVSPVGSVPRALPASITYRGKAVQSCDTLPTVCPAESGSCLTPHPARRTWLALLFPWRQRGDKGAADCPGCGRRGHAEPVPTCPAALTRCLNTTRP